MLHSMVSSLLPFDVRLGDLLGRKLPFPKRPRQFLDAVNVGDSLHLRVLQPTALVHPMHSGLSSFYIVDQVRGEQLVSGCAFLGDDTLPRLLRATHDDSGFTPLRRGDTIGLNTAESHAARPRKTTRYQELNPKVG